MSDPKIPKPNIFQKVMAATDIWLQGQIVKGQSEIQKEAELEDEADFFYRKSVARDMQYQNGSQGFLEKPIRITNEHLKQMSLKDSIIASIIQTRQNQVAGFSKLVKSPFDKGFKILLKDELKHLEDIKEKLKKTPGFAPKKKPKEENPLEAGAEEQPEIDEEQPVDEAAPAQDNMKKADPEDLSGEASDTMSDKAETSEGSDEDDSDATDDDEAQKINWRLERKAKEILNRKFANRRRAVEQFIINCGKMKDRPFESLRWNFDSFLRASVRDSLTYDQMATEIVPDQADRAHHIVPVDGSTIRYASPELGKYKDFPLYSSYDILYPEKEFEALDKKDALKLDVKLLEQDKYKWTQVIRGRIERAFTQSELKVGMRNPTADIYNNGYSIPELELLIGLVSSHLNTEYYNQAYFSQGFSAKGILHLKAPLNRRKVETIRQQWQHMIKGSRNSFQTPIFAGMDEVNWIPLTQNHSDIEFQGWLQYLIKMICAIYQIDPQEIGIGMKEEGSKGSGLSGDNTQEKIDLSRDKGLYPLLRFLENFINVNIIDSVDSEFYLEFVGLKDESMQDALKRQEAEAKYKKTVNETRAEDGLPPLPGMDDVILDPTYMQWYTTFSEKGKANAEEQQSQAMTGEAMNQPPPQMPPNAAEPHVAAGLETQSMEPPQGGPPGQPVEKALKIEYYRLRG